MSISEKEKNNLGYNEIKSKSCCLLIILSGSYISAIYERFRLRETCPTEHRLIPGM